MIGRLTTPTRAKTEPALPPREGPQKAVARAIYTRKRKKRISTEVRRAPQTHHVPHIGRPQSDPLARQTKVNAAPIGAASRAATWARGCRQTSATALASATNR